MTELPPPLGGIDQTRFGFPPAPPDEQGNCWATVVACFAGLTSAHRDELHDLIVTQDWIERDGGEPTNWWDVTNTFLTERGRPTLTVADEIPDDQVAIASGPSPRNTEYHHAILAYGDGTTFWDPHPDRAGLISIDEWIAWWAPPCSKCGRPNLRTPQRYCHDCHALYQRNWRAAQRERIQRERATLYAIQDALARGNRTL